MSEATTPKKVPPHVRKLDLSVINNPLSMTGMAAAPQNQINVVLELPLEEVMEDPHQPRTQFDEETLNNLASDIKTRGVQQPITVRPKNAANQYVIIQGARRYRASKLAGNTTIPAIVQKDQDKFNDYAQVTENTQRENLSALDLAAFMQKRKEAGDSAKTIAENLGERQEAITRYLTLVSADTPAILKEAFQSGKINGICAFYDLLQLWKSDPARAENLLAEDAEITQKTVRMAKPKQTMAQQTGAPETPPAHTEQQTSAASAAGDTDTPHQPESKATESTNATNGDDSETSAMPPDAHDQHQEASDGSKGEGELEHDDEGGGGNEEGADADANAGDSDAKPPETQRLPYHNPALDKAEPAPHDPGKIKKPLLLGTHQDRNIKVLLNRAPSAVGFIHIQYEDTMELSEALMREIQLTMLSEMKVQEVG